MIELILIAPVAVFLWRRALLIWRDLQETGELR